jgi:hypothetical protein
VVTGATHGIIKRRCGRVDQIWRQEIEQGSESRASSCDQPRKMSLDACIICCPSMTRRPDRSTMSARFPLFTGSLPNCCITTSDVAGQNARHTDGRSHLHCELNSRRSLVLGPRYHEIHEYWQAAILRDAREAQRCRCSAALHVGRRRARLPVNRLNPAFAERLPSCRISSGSL